MFFVTLAFMIIGAAWADSEYFQCAAKCDKTKPVNIYKACVQTCAIVHGPQGAQHYVPAQYRLEEQIEK